MIVESGLIAMYVIGRHSSEVGRYCSLSLKVAFMLLALAGVVAVYKILERDVKLAPTLEAKYGFATDARYTPSDGLPDNVLYLSYVKAGGEFQRLGFLPKDVILSHDRASFYEALSVTLREDDVRITVGRGPEFSATDSLERHTITIPSRK